MFHIDRMRESPRKPPTLLEMVEARIACKKGDVFLRADFEDIGGYVRVGRILRQLI